MNKLVLLTFTMSTLASSIHYAVAADNESSQASELQTLFQQAEFWQGKQRQDLAKDALNRVLLAAPDNTEAMYRLALIALQENDKVALQRLTQQISLLAPHSQYLQDLKSAQAVSGDNRSLKEARLLTANGQYEEAITKYQTLFSGDKPPASIAMEYFRTLSATKDGWPKAKIGLEQLLNSQPNNTELAVVYAEILTYREQTRRDGIKRLASYSTQSPDADKAWRTALLWLTAADDDKPLYDAYLKAHSGDVAVAEYYKKQTTLTPEQQAARYRDEGYRAYQAGHYDTAAKAFKASIAIDNRDADALAGLGLVELKRSQFRAAAQYLAKAMQLEPAQKSQWQQAYTSAVFYSELAKARALEQQKKYDDALLVVAPLTTENNNRSRDAKLLQGEILQRVNRLNDAEVVFRKLLQQNDKDTQARIGLVDVLRQQQRWDEATAISNQLPVAAQGQLSELASSQAMLLRDRASSENNFDAEATLRQASELAPDNPWVRLDLARILNKTQRSIAAKLLISRGVQQYGTHDDRYVAALFAEDQQRWDDAIELLQRIPPLKRNEAENSLLESLTLRARLAEIERRQQVGDREGSRQLMTDLFNHPPKSAAGIGQVASVLYNHGEVGMALLLIRQHHQKTELTAPASDYLQQILVLNKAGVDDEADSLLARLSQRHDLSTADWQDIERIRNAIAVVKADRLRKMEEFAPAYDILAQRLRVAPQDEGLLLAMARLYQSGDKGKKSLQIYRYALKQNPNSDEALTGAVTAAISVNELGQADEMLQVLDADKAQQPAMLLLAAKVAQAKGDDKQALALLNQSRKQLFQNEPEQPWLAAIDGQPSFSNPFATAVADLNTTTVAPDNRTARPQWLPGSDELGLEQASWNANPSDVQPSIAQQIDALIADIHKKDATVVQTAMTFSSREGESGLGKLSKVTAPTSLETHVGSGKLSFSVTPTYLNGGTLDSGFDRFGTGMGAQAATTLNSDLDNLSDVLDTFEQSAYDYYEAEQLSIAAQKAVDAGENITQVQLAQYALDADRALRTYQLAAQQNLWQAIGVDVENAQSSLDIEALQALISKFNLDIDIKELQQATDTLLSTDVTKETPEEFIASFTDNRQKLETLVESLQSTLSDISFLAQNPDAQHDAGIALSLGYSNDLFAVDIGTTPLGFEKTNLVGGISWTPQLTPNTQLNVGVERRGVEDSVLSYAGTVDPLTGETWGGVTKTGLNLGLGFDDGGLGLYSSLAGYVYKGSHVGSNTEIAMSLGGYIRPLKDSGRELQTGVHIAFETFDKNLGHYSFGHGGYFSPKDYVSLAFPVQYSEKHENYSYSVNFAPGFQSFTEDSVNYFPNEPELQALLDVLHQLSLVDESVYAANSKTGFGMSLTAKGEYQFSSSFSLGGNVGFNNFGNFQETTAQLYLKYLLGVKSE